MESADAMTEVQEQGSQEQDSSSSSGNIVAWPLLQKGLKKALGETRDQLEFTIKIRSMFDAFDHSGDGQLDGNELRKELRRMGVLVSKREMDGLMLRFDQNRDNQIDFGEFQDMVNDLIPPPEFDLGGIFLEQKLAAMFSSMDTNGDQQLDAQEISAGLLKLGLTVTQDHLSRIMQQADTSGDGTINYDEFVQLYSKYEVKHHSDQELREIEEKWQLPEQIVRDNREPFNDPMCKPGQMVKICRAYENSAGYQKFLGPGLLTRPVENQPGRWFVVFKNSGETFLNVGRHGVYELAYMEQWESKTVERKKMQEKKKKLQTQDFGEPEQVEDDTSVFNPPSCHMQQGLSRWFSRKTRHSPRKYDKSTRATASEI